MRCVRLCRPRVSIFLVCRRRLVHKIEGRPVHHPDKEV